MKYNHSVASFLNMALSTILMLTACEMKGKESDKVESPEAIFRKLMEAVGNNKEIKCPSYSPRLEGTKTMCFAGVGDTEDVVKSLAVTLKPYITTNVYFSRDYAIWNASVYLKGMNSDSAIQIFEKGNTISMRNDPAMQEYDYYLIFVY